MSFVELCLEGRVHEEDIEQFVEDWHQGREGAGLEPHEYLGISWDEYQLWASTPLVLSFVVAARTHGVCLDHGLALERPEMMARASLGEAITSLEARLWGPGTISPDLAVRLERAGIGNARTWLAVQADWDLWQAERREQPVIHRFAEIEQSRMDQDGDQSGARSLSKS